MKRKDWRRARLESTNQEVAVTQVRDDNGLHYGWGREVKERLTDYSDLQ